MPLHRHYNRNLISNPGEKAFDQALDDLLEDDARTWHVCHSVRIGRHPTKKTAEHDFVLVTKEGVVVVEVKGGLVGMRKGQFVHLPDEREHFHEREFKENPLDQAHGCAAALIYWCKEKEIRDTLVTPAVAFPMCRFGYAEGEYRTIWSTATPEPLAQFLLDLLRDARRTATWARDLSAEQQQRLAKEFTPTVMPQRHAEQFEAGAELAERRKAENERILDGLSDNMRIMVQGPPGSGKSPYALRYMQQKAEAGQRGLYLCWNELLAARVSQLIGAQGLSEQVDVRAFYPFAQEVLVKAGIAPTLLDHDTMDQLPQLLDEAFAVMRSQQEPTEWDYIVADECQDLFHRGIDRVLQQALRGKEDGLTQGHYLVLYDLSYADELHLNNAYNRLLHSAAHYRLAHHYRGTGGDGLNPLLVAVEQGEHDLDRPYGSDVKVVRYAALKDVPALVYTNYLTLCGGKAKPEEAVLLLHSTLLRGRDGDPQELMSALAADPRFEHLAPENLAQPSKGLRYTTMLKYKGLDKPLVILVLPPLLKWDKKLHHQFLVGASRASVRLCVLAPEKVPA